MSDTPLEEEGEFQKPHFETTGEAPPPKEGEPRLDLILNIPVTLAMEIGRTRLSIGNLLQLTPGSVVRLEKPVGEPLDILVNGCLVAKGEVVVVNEKLAMRITDIASKEERVKMLK